MTDDAKDKTPVDADQTAQIIDLVNQRNELNGQITTLKSEAEDYKAQIEDLKAKIEGHEQNEIRLNKLVMDNVVFKDKPIHEDDQADYGDSYADVIKRNMDRIKG